MKKLKDYNFPYPVLLEDGGNFNNAKFLVDYDIKINEGKLYIKCKVDLSCGTIENFINKDEAFILFHIEQRTLRKVQPCSLDKECNIILPLEWFSPDYNIEIVAMIVAKKDIVFKYDDNMQIVYSYFDEDFCCKRGSILGYSNFEEFALPSSGKISSIFTLSEYKDPKEIAEGKPFKIELSNDVIDILVLPKIKENFVKIREKHFDQNLILNSVFVYPAIEMAIFAMFKNYESYKNLKWCIALSNKIADAKKMSFDTLLGMDIEYDDIIDYTHVVLEDLLSEAFVDTSEGV